MNGKEIRLAIYGACIGDFIGSQWEPIKEKPERLGDNMRAKSPCEFTDDTKMTMAVANAIMISGEPSDFASEMRRIGRKYGGGYGGMFLRWLYSSDPKPYGSIGNGACMRVSPAGLAAKSIAEAHSIAEKATSVTHDSEESEMYAMIVSDLVFEAKRADGMEEMWKAVKSISRPLFAYLKSMGLEELHRNYEFDVTCGGSVPEAIYCFLSSSSFSDCLNRAIYIGGDSDTIAAIACSIAAPFYGDGQVSEYMHVIDALPTELRRIAELFSERYLC